jgi:hypothetical protein
VRLSYRRADRLRLTPPDELRSCVLTRRTGHLDCADLMRPKSLSGKGIRQNVGTILMSAQSAFRLRLQTGIRTDFGLSMSNEHAVRRISMHRVGR